MLSTDPLIILIAEDDPNDVLLLRRAFQKNGLDLPVHVCTDGQDAIDYLRAHGPYADREKYPFPRAIITDLKMPRCSGFELLQWLDEHAECSVIPTIVLSASAEDRDVTVHGRRFYRVEGAGFRVQVPVGMHQLQPTVAPRRVGSRSWS